MELSAEGQPIVLPFSLLHLDGGLYGSSFHLCQGRDAGATEWGHSCQGDAKRNIPRRLTCVSASSFAVRVVVSSSCN